MVVKSFMDGEPLDPTAVEIDQKEKKLLLDLKPNSDRALYDICDNNGKILCTGYITEKENKIDVCLDKLDPGIYTVCIVDGDQLNRKRFEVK